MRAPAQRTERQADAVPVLTHAQVSTPMHTTSATGAHGSTSIDTDTIHPASALRPTRGCQKGQLTSAPFGRFWASSPGGIKPQCLSLRGHQRVKREHFQGVCLLINTVNSFPFTNINSWQSVTKKERGKKKTPSCKPALLYHKLKPESFLSA